MIISAPYFSPPALSNNTLSPVSTDPMCMGAGPSSGPWETYQ